MAVGPKPTEVSRDAPGIGFVADMALCSTPRWGEPARETW